MFKRNAKIVLFSLACLAALNGLLAVTRAAQIGLPAGQGVELARAKCLSCHEADLIVAQTLARAGWVREIEKMTRWGAQVSDEEKQVLADYFVVHFAPVKAAVVVSDVALGQAIFATKCLNCHGDDLIKPCTVACSDSRLRPG